MMGAYVPNTTAGALRELLSFRIYTSLSQTTLSLSRAIPILVALQILYRWRGTLSASILIQGTYGLELWRIFALCLCATLLFGRCTR